MDFTILKNVPLFASIADDQLQKISPLLIEKNIIKMQSL